MSHEYQTKLRFISDSGHGWLEVPTADVEASGYVPSKYSYYIPQHGQAQPLYYTYLEEDCDFTEYLKAYRHPLDIADVHVAGQCWIRDLPHCPGPAVEEGE